MAFVASKRRNESGPKRAVHIPKLIVINTIKIMRVSLMTSACNVALPSQREQVRIIISRAHPRNGKTNFTPAIRQKESPFCSGRLRFFCLSLPTMLTGVVTTGQSEMSVSFIHRPTIHQTLDYVHDTNIYVSF